MSKSYAIYLRKSRVDLEAEARGEGDTLKRHRNRLLALSKQQGLTITKIYPEVVSGETITSRPLMQQLLHDVEDGLYAGVLVMEVERLARGDTIDQGIVARAFQYSGTKIITPAKTYDPLNEFDQEYFEFGLYMSRREYKTINRRQQAGRIASVSEGKWPANRAPYGYRRIKLDGQKGWTLEPDENATVVQDIFRWYTEGVPQPDGSVNRIGVSRIIRRLNESNILSPGGKDWTNSAIQSLLRNPTYAGWVRWGNRAQVKKIQDGEVQRSRPRAKAGDTSLRLCRGLHDPLISQETFDTAQALLRSNPGRPGPKRCVTTNPLAGLIRCDHCGRMMVRRTYIKNGYPPTLMCPYTSCPTVSSDCSLIESMVLQGMRKFLADFEQTPMEQDTEAESTERAALSRSVSSLKKELEQIDTQEQKAYDLVEQGIYTPEVFTDRTTELSRRRQAAEKQLETLLEAVSGLDSRVQAKKEIAPAFRRVLDNFELAETAKEKNELLKSVLNHVEYHKTIGGRYRESDLSIKLAPKLPN